MPCMPFVASHSKSLVTVRNAVSSVAHVNSVTTSYSFVNVLLACTPPSFGKMSAVAPRASRCAVLSIPVNRAVDRSRCHCTHNRNPTSGVLEYRVVLSDVGTKRKCRIDALLSMQYPTISRERIKASIRSGEMSVNDVVCTKPSFACNVGDLVRFSIPSLPKTVAEPEKIPLEIFHEDGDVLVVNKAAGMVVHPSPGHSGGTLVNAVLHHYSLPAVSLDNVDASALPTSIHQDDDDEMPTSNSAEFSSAQQQSHSSEAVIRPGIVHRLDKGTTGLMVVCRTDAAMLVLGEQFRNRTINRLYWSITIGVPKDSSGEVCTNIGRHPSDRLKMSVYGFGSSRGREAVSTYKVVRTLANNSAAVVQWKLKTGRTHQIRVHAQHLGCPLFGDASYGGVHHAVSKIGRGHKQREQAIQGTLADLARPALHASVLGFQHPTSGGSLHFESNIPQDLQRTLRVLDSLYEVQCTTVGRTD
eukprot:jgi/Ulvmu1/9967/UM059_0016.1